MLRKFGGLIAVAVMIVVLAATAPGRRPDFGFRECHTTFSDTAWARF